MKTPLLLLAALSLAGCSALQGLGRKPDAPASDLATEIAPPVRTTVLGGGQAPAALDQTSAAEKAAALAAPAKGGEKALGKAVVALGAPAEPGLWLQTALVSAPVQGRVVAPGGQSLALELRPGTGGALMSLSAYQALGIGLTDLPEVTIYGP
ncbi:hypothetical protein [Xinfangfangia pollutisoli]|uniref:hypothetical protein n=1 Tax=Xinfangfangia pollutisoli TaxID=2865960 RepID=UPI001CD3F650|nr:hypothetical protein [Xinfangfangia pollutisoli]